MMEGMRRLTWMPVPLLLLAVASCGVAEPDGHEKLPAADSWFRTLPAENQAALLWFADHETGNASQWENGQPWASGKYSWDIVESPVHSGKFALSSTIDTAGITSGVRWPRRWVSDGSDLPDAAWYSVWMRLPVALESSGEFYNFMQWKTADGKGGSDPVWSVNIIVDPQGAMRFELFSRVGDDGGFKTEGFGPRGTSPLVIEPDRWVHVEARYKWDTADDGAIEVWQDGERVFGADGVRTQFPYPPTEHQRQWAVNAYANGLEPNPHTLIIDDAAISTMRLR
jgi:Polysaccharide lyase